MPGSEVDRRLLPSALRLLSIRRLLRIGIQFERSVDPKADVQRLVTASRMPTFAHLT